MQAPQPGSAFPRYFRFAVLTGTVVLLVVYSVLIVLNLTGVR